MATCGFCALPVGPSPENRVDTVALGPFHNSCYPKKLDELDAVARDKEKARVEELLALRRVVREQEVAMQKLLDQIADADRIQEAAKNVLLDGMGENCVAMNDPARDSSALRHAHNHMAEAYVLLNGGAD